MKKYQVKINNMELEIIQDDDGKFITPYLCIEDWEKFGTTLKPSFEPIIVARKPLDGTCVNNVLKWGVGGINIDECRIGTEKRTYKGMSSHKPDGAGTFRDDNWEPKDIEVTVNGRFPANTILTYNEDNYDEVCQGFPETKKNGSITKKYEAHNEIYGKRQIVDEFEAYNDSGSASRYFYCAKASKKDRNDGLENKHNTHPTVKPTSLMQYLIRLVTPKNGIILDPFMGSGSTGKAAAYENKERQANYSFIGIEMEKEYCDMAKSRIEFVNKED